MKDELWKIFTAAALLLALWVAIKLGLLELVGEWVLSPLQPE